MKEASALGEGVMNAETLSALEEIKEMRAHPERYKSYGSFQEALDDVLNQEETPSDGAT